MSHALRIPSISNEAPRDQRHVPDLVACDGCCKRDCELHRIGSKEDGIADLCLTCLMKTFEGDGA